MKTVSKLSACCFKGRKEAAVLGTVPVALSVPACLLAGSHSYRVAGLLVLLLILRCQIPYSGED